MDGIVQKYHPNWLMNGEIPPNAMPVDSQNRAKFIKVEPKYELKSKADSKKGGDGLRTCLNQTQCHCLGKGKR